MRRRRYYREFDDEYFEQRSLRLDTRHKKIGGVCAGVANYLGWSRTTVRVLSLISLIAMPQVALPSYGIAYLIMDRDERSADAY
jgi:phage shock protein C